MRDYPTWPHSAWARVLLWFDLPCAVLLVLSGGILPGLGLIAVIAVSAVYFS